MEKILELLSKSLNCVYELIDNISRDNNFMILDQQQKLLGLDMLSINSYTQFKDLLNSSNIFSINFLPCNFLNNF